MKKIIFSALCALPLIVSLTSCGKKKDEPNQPSTPEAVTKTVTIDASKYETWQYFSFSKGEVVNVTDYKNDLNWDMALHRYDVRLNCGESGKGKGGAVFSGKTEMDQATTVPTDGYTVDVLGRSSKFKYKQRIISLTYVFVPLALKPRYIHSCPFM